jgi:hypothetical protein
MTEAEAQSKLADRLWRLSHPYKIKTKDKRLATFSRTTRSRSTSPANPTAT